MRTDRPSLKMGYWLPAILVCLLLSLVVFYSCKPKKKEQALVVGLKSTDIDASCFQLSKDQIKTAWVDPGLIGQVNYIAFYTSWDPLSHAYGVRAQAYDLGNNGLGSPITLTKGANCDLKLPPLSIGENTITMSSLDILDAGGQLKAFDYVLLTPKQFSPPTGPVPPGQYLSYEAQVTGEPVPPPAKYTLPCPPCIYCRPPCDSAIFDISAPPQDDTARKEIK